MSLLDFIPIHVKHAMDTGVIGTALASFFGLFTLSNLTAVLGLIYLLIRISETERAKQFFAWLRRKCRLSH